MWEYEVIVPVYCRKEDFVAAGDEGDICFRKIEIKKEDYDYTLNQAKKKTEMLDRIIDRANKGNLNEN